METRSENACRVVRWVTGPKGGAVVLRHIGQATPGRVTWSVHFTGVALGLLDTVASGLRRRSEACRIAEAFAAGGAA